MATSQQLRNWYPELVVGNVDSRWNVTSTRPKCDYTKCVKVPFLADRSIWPSGTVALNFHPAAAEAFHALSTVFQAYNYAFREHAGGSVSCRKITGGTRTSLHAHGVAMDINPSKNAYRKTALRGLIQWGRQTDMPKAMINDIEAIKTRSGARVFLWGGRWNTIKDPMHFQINVPQTVLETGIDWTTVRVEPVVAIEEEEIMKTSDLQKALNLAGAKPKLVVDNDFGPKTQAALVKALTGGFFPTTNSDLFPMDVIVTGNLRMEGTD